MMRWAKLALAVAALVVGGLILIGRNSQAERARRDSSDVVLTRTTPDRLPPFNGDRAAASAETAPAAVVSDAPPAAAAPSGGASLPAGEYACVGSDGSILAGLGFKVDGGGRYTDLDGTTSGTVSVDGSAVNFSGGHMDGMSGRNFHGGNFVLGSMASCEKWG